MTPSEIWPMLAGAAVVVFGAGRLSAIVMNGRHVTKDYCSKQHELTNEKFVAIMEGQATIREDIHALKLWINKGGVA